MFRHKQGLHTYTLKVCTNVNDLIFDLKKIIIKKKNQLYEGYNNSSESLSSCYMTMYNTKNTHNVVYLQHISIIRRIYEFDQ